jgi:hypothetical protein
VWVDCSTQFHFAFGRLQGCCQSDVTPLFDCCFDAEPFQDGDQGRRIGVFDLKCVKCATLWVNPVMDALNRRPIR